MTNRELKKTFPELITIANTALWILESSQPTTKFKLLTIKDNKGKLTLMIRSKSSTKIKK